MNTDDVLFGLIVCGIGLAGACFRREYVLLGELRAAQRRKEEIMHRLHGERLSSQTRTLPRMTTQTAVMNEAQLMIDDVARPENA